MIAPTRDVCLIRHSFSLRASNHHHLSSFSLVSSLSRPSISFLRPSLCVWPAREEGEEEETRFGGQRRDENRRGKEDDVTRPPLLDRGTRDFVLPGISCIEKGIVGVDKSEERRWRFLARPRWTDLIIMLTSVIYMYIYIFLEIICS